MHFPPLLNSRLVILFRSGGNGKHPAQEKMGRPINKREGSDKNHGEMPGSRTARAMKERILIRVVHIESRRQEPRGHKKNRGNRCLQRQSAAVVSNFPLDASIAAQPTTGGCCCMQAS